MEYYFIQDSTPLAFFNSVPENALNEQLKAVFGRRVLNRSSVLSQKPQPHAQRRSHNPYHIHAEYPYASTTPQFLRSTPYAFSYPRSTYADSELDNLLEQQSEIQKKKALADKQREFHKKQLELIELQESELQYLYEQIEGKRRKFFLNTAETARESCLNQVERQNKIIEAKGQPESIKQQKLQQKILQQQNQEKERKQQDPIENFFKVLLSSKRKEQVIADKNGTIQPTTQRFFDFFLSPELGQKAEEESTVSSLEKSSQSDKLPQTKAPVSQVPIAETKPQDQDDVPKSFEYLYVPFSSTGYERLNPKTAEKPASVSALHAGFSSASVSSKPDRDEKSSSFPQQKAYPIEITAPVESVKNDKPINVERGSDQNPEKAENPLESIIYDSILKIVQQKIKDIDTQEEQEKATNSKNSTPNAVENPKPASVRKFKPVEFHCLSQAEAKKNSVSTPTVNAGNKASFLEDTKNQQRASTLISDAPVCCTASDSDVEFKELRRQVREKLTNFKDSIDCSISPASKKQNIPKNFTRKHQQKYHPFLQFVPIYSHESSIANPKSNLKSQPLTVPAPELAALNSNKNKKHSCSPEAEGQEAHERRQNICASIVKIAEVDKKVNEIINTHEKQVFSNPLKFSVGKNGKFLLAFTNRNSAYRKYVEELQRNLESLDSISTYNDSRVRTPRKALVLKIQSVLDGLDTYLESQESDYSSGDTSEQELVSLEKR